jgi:hypothetical protein
MPDEGVDRGDSNVLVHYDIIRQFADMKVLLLAFFLIPAIAIRWALKGAQ